MHHGADGYATAGKDGAFRLWDQSFAPITCVNLLDSSVAYPGLSIRSVCWAGDRIACGTQDSEIFEVTVQDKLHPVALAQGHADGELWGLAVHPREPLFLTASDDRTVRVWSTASHACTARKALPAEARSAQFSPAGDRVAVGLKDGRVLVLRFPELTQAAALADRQEAVHSLKFSPDGAVLAVGCNDGYVDFYNAATNDGFGRLGSSARLASFVTQMDFSTDGTLLQVNLGNGERLFLRAPGGGELAGSGGKPPKGTYWHTWTSVFGEEVNGIWGRSHRAVAAQPSAVTCSKILLPLSPHCCCESPPQKIHAQPPQHRMHTHHPHTGTPAPRAGKYTDANDVNATDICKGLVVSGDDFGRVKLFRYPTGPDKGARHRSYGGHSAHVTNVRFTPDCATLLSTGGADHAVFQWRLHAAGGQPDGHYHSHSEDSGTGEVSPAFRKGAACIVPCNAQRTRLHLAICTRVAPQPGSHPSLRRRSGLCGRRGVRGTD